MATELFTKTMQNVHARTEYVGALLDGERRLTLVQVPKEDPWGAFRALRRIMRGEASADQALLGMFEADSPIEHQADVISLESRRRAG